MLAHVVRCLWCGILRRLPAERKVHREGETTRYGREDQSQVPGKFLVPPLQAALEVARSPEGQAVAVAKAIHRIPDPFQLGHVSMPFPPLLTRAAPPSLATRERGRAGEGRKRQRGQALRKAEEYVEWKREAR